ncbi:MAG: PKD domain-containing protein [Solirubrobacterales bacterium]
MFAIFGTDGNAPRADRPGSARLAAFALAAALTATIVACLCIAQPAGAVVTSVGGHQFGVQPETFAELNEITEPLSYEGGPVVHSTAPYALYWDQHTGEYRGSWEELISGFLQNAGTASGALDNNFAVIAQYHDATGGKSSYDMTFRGAYTDTDAYPASGNCSEAAPCLTDAQIRAELTKYIVANGLPTGLNPGSGPTPIYYVFTPPRVTVCLEGSGEADNCSSQGSEHPLCSYHSFIPAGGPLASTVLYAVEPWTAGNYGTISKVEISGSGCQDGTKTLQEPNQIGLGPEGEYSTGLADLIINNVSDQALSTATNPLFTGWHDTGVDKAEVVDKCRNDFYGGELLKPPGNSVEEHTKAGIAHNQTIGGRQYYLNDVFDQAAVFAAYPGVPCINGVSVTAEFTPQNPIRSGDIATFNATESVVSLGIQKYLWSFGDGTGAEVDCGQHVPTNGYSPEECTSASGTGNPNPVASTAHVYTYGGDYDVSLTVTDYAGNIASVTHTVTVNGPPPPPPPAPPTPPAPGGPGTGSGSSTPGTTTTGAGAGAAKPKVVATQAVSSHSLASVLRSGLVVRYSVSSQVAGRFEVLLASSVAKKIGLKGPVATGLAKGTPPQIVIAKAILVTTKGGHNSYKIKFSKSTAARLRKLHKVSLMVRMVVHNPSSPVPTTVLSSVNLSH